jgi:membrane-bound lytic murein transglycosylase F
LQIKMADNQSKNLANDISVNEGSGRIGIGPMPHRVRRVKIRLSIHNRFVLLVVCLIALGILVMLYATVPEQVAQTEQVAILVEVAPVEITYEEMFREIAPRYELNWRVLAGLAYQESRFNPLAVGKNNDAGLMQIIPATWDEWAPTVGVSDPFDPYSNVLVAAAYLAFLRDYFGEMGYPEAHWMLVAYNWGPYNLRQLLEDGGGWSQVPQERRRYALDVLHSASETPPGWEEIRARPIAEGFP